MKRILLSFASAVALSACSSSPRSSPAADAGPATISAPTIWLQPSSSVDPTALPLRAQQYVTTAPAQGFVYVCDAMAFSQTNGPGSVVTGPWVHEDAGTYDVTKKIFVHGNVYYATAELTITPAGDVRTVKANGFPVGVPTGVFPVSATDPAWKYDPNPNSLTVQAISFSIPRNPVTTGTVSCVYKEVGITLDGVPLHCPLDSSGRDELAYQLQDVCTGAPQPGGGYHRHGLSECTPHIHEKTALVGYALDGFGIFSPYDANGKELTSADLDECHGTTSEVAWEGQTVSMYHYVMTRDFPYTVACFRGTPTRNAFPALPGAPPQH